MENGHSIGLHWQVVRVLDGDNFEVLHNQHPEYIRLSGIDCPEKGQAFDLLADPVAALVALAPLMRLPARP
ncbi:MAG TPA: hypothetical protein VGQ08_01460 [Nitrospiraceae bacterium]|jgi:endonuclease YncB( thermonuclease family)|nr:hypothetical protein [Nitrospiraceae bacterium]